MVRGHLFPLLIIVALFALGCSVGSQIPTSPGDGNNVADASGPGSHVTWGLYQFIADPVAGTLDVAPIRAGNMHLNALGFLEPPPLAYLTLESAPHFNGNILDIDIGLRHPFSGLVQYTGFDVCGILISNGSISNFNDPKLIMAGDAADTHLTNPDGYSPWWNPANFAQNPNQPIFGYIDGLLGVPDAVANFNSTICGYKYFADGLAPDDPVETLDLQKRGMFSAGVKNVRHYTVHLGENGLVFNYAVDASWKLPAGQPPWDVPGSFSISANRPEAFLITVTQTENSLYYSDEQNKGGMLGLDIMVYDWQGAGTINSVKAEWPGLPVVLEETSPIETGQYFGKYHFDFDGASLISSAPVDVFVTVEDAVQHPALGNVCAFYPAGEFTVDDVPPGNDKVGMIFYCADYGVSRDIFSIDPEGDTDFVQWTFQTDPAMWCEGPEVSPDGRYVLYLRYSWSTLGSELRRLELATHEDISLSDDSMSSWFVYGAWRHDQQKIVYSWGTSIMENGEIYTMNPDGSDKQLLATTGLYPWAPEYSPDDSTIVFQSFTDSQLYTYDIATTELTKYTDNGTWNDDPTYSPDGTHIAWATMAGMSGGRHIYISPLDSWTPPTWEVGFEDYIRSPSFSPDGSQVVFDHGGYDDAELAIYNLSDGSWQDITSNAWGDYQADWGMVEPFD